MGIKVISSALVEKYHQVLQMMKAISKPIIDYYYHHIFWCRIFAVIIFRLALDINYTLSLSKHFAYMGFVFSPNIVCICVSWLITFAFAVPISLLLGGRSASSIIVLLFNCLYFLPAQTLYALCGLSNQYYFSLLIYWALLLIAQHFIPQIHLVMPSWNYKKLFKILIWILCIFVFVVSWKYTNFRIIFNLLEVYTYRSEAASYQYPRIVAYSISMMATVIPVLLMYAWVHKWYISVAMLFASGYLLFSIDGAKTTLFLLFLAILGVVLYRERRVEVISWALAGGACAGVLESVAIGTPYITSYIYRRVMMVPTWIGSIYFDYFSTHDPDIWRSGILRRFGLQSPYLNRVGSMISQLYTNADGNMCTGLVGDAIYAFGKIGIFILPFIIILCLRLLDASSNNLDKRYLIGICAFFAVSFMNVPWSTVLLSNGLIAICVLFCCWNTETGKRIGEV